IVGEVLAASRTASVDDSCDNVVSLLNRGAGAQAIWDGLFLAGGELLMRQPGIVALHSLTSLNALHYAHRTTGEESTRKLTLLQAAAFVPLFREAMKSRGKVGEVTIDSLETPDDHHPAKDATAIFATLSKNKLSAAQMAMAFLKSRPGSMHEITDEARRLVFLKGRDSHDYKFSSAVLEDAQALSPAARDQFLAASLFWLKGSGDADSGLVKRTRAALA
ncbi:MAG TPA: hypothetical protein VLM40_09370, partial [Gemmata sp.]|nr:hypothetical protein [Gemmata sp.]